MIYKGRHRLDQRTPLVNALIKNRNSPYTEQDHSSLSRLSPLALMRMHDKLALREWEMEAFSKKKLKTRKDPHNTSDKSRDVIDAIIASEASPFEEDDRADLEAMSGRMLKKLAGQYKPDDEEPEAHEEGEPPFKDEDEDAVKAMTAFLPKPSAAMERARRNAEYEAAAEKRQAEYVKANSVRVNANSAEVSIMTGATAKDIWQAAYPAKYRNR